MHPPRCSPRKDFHGQKNDWEDGAEADKTWAEWKAAYKKAQAKARVKAQDNKGFFKFGAANSAARVENKHEVETNQGVEKWGMESIDGYFDNLSTTTVNKKSVLEQLVTNNTKIASTNEDLVGIFKKWTNGIKNLERETSRLKRKCGKVKRDPTLCHH